MLRRTRRAPTACSWCHHRKVRCDASILGSPCTRCRQDGRKKCILRPKNPKQSQNLARFPSSMHQALNHSDELSCQSSGELSQDRCHGSIHSEFCAHHNILADHFSCSQSRTSYASLSKYGFLDSIQLLSIPAEDATFLESKECFILPAPAALDQFIRLYFERVHPLVPVLDEAKFWSIYRNHKPSGSKISLFVFQALLFASSAFVPLVTLSQCGFKDRRDARKQLYKRAKLLFELKTEKSFHKNSQGAVLLTHYTSADDPRSGTLWVTRAIENAMLIDSQASSLVDIVPMSLKKRLWWSILLRDRSLGIGLRRRPQVTSISPHGWSDWLSTEDFEDEMYHSEVYVYETKQLLLAALQQQCQLAVLLTKLASLIFTHRRIPRQLLSMAEFEGLMSSIKTIQKSLDNWPNPPLARQGSTSKGDGAITTLNYLTHMYYYAAKVDLAQFAAFVLEENLFYAGDSYSDTVLHISGDLGDGVEGLSIVMEHFSMNGHADSLPLSVLGYVSMPLVLAAIDLKLSPSRAETKTRQKRLDLLGSIIRHSEALYDVTDVVAVGTNRILQLAHATTQSLLDEQAPEVSLGDITADYTLSSNRCQRLSPSGTISSKPLRPTSWQEAFVRCPRAYLLISTSVDYSLAVGRLPSASSLPDIVRDLPAMGFISRLPWTSDIPFSQFESPSHSFNHRDSLSSIDGRRDSETASTVIGSETDFIYQKNQQNNTFSEHSSSLTRDDDAQRRNEERNRVLHQTIAMNLDYMDFVNQESLAGAEEDFDLGPPLEFLSNDLRVHISVERPTFDTNEVALPESIQSIDTCLFESFYYEAFGQNWVTS